MAVGVAVNHQRPGPLTRASTALTEALGRPWVVLAAIGLVLLWAPSYVLIRDVNTWQLVVNTATTIVTFILGFAILSTENRENRALHAKLDALIACTPGACNRLVGLEDANEAEIKAEQERVRGEVQ